MDSSVSIQTMQASDLEEKFYQLLKLEEGLTKKPIVFKVMYKLPAINLKEKGKTIFKFILADKSTHILALTFQKDISAKLKENQFYKLDTGGAEGKPVNLLYPSPSNHKFELTLRDVRKISPSTKFENILSHLDINFKTFAETQSEGLTNCNVIARILNEVSSRGIMDKNNGRLDKRRRNIMIQDNNGARLGCTLWGHHASALKQKGEFFVIHNASFKDNILHVNQKSTIFVLTKEEASIHPWMLTNTQKYLYKHFLNLEEMDDEITDPRKLRKVKTTNPQNEAKAEDRAKRSYTPIRTSTGDPCSSNSNENGFSSLEENITINSSIVNRMVRTNSKVMKCNWTVKEVSIRFSNVHRYWGCSFCTKSLKVPLKNGKFKCKSKICVRRETTRKICYCIKNMSIAKYNQQIDNVVCFDEAAKQIMEKPAASFSHDLECQDYFDERINDNLFTLTLSRKCNGLKRNKYGNDKWILIIQNILNIQNVKTESNTDEPTSKYLRLERVDFKLYTDSPSADLTETIETEETINELRIEFEQLTCGTKELDVIVKTTQPQFVPVPCDVYKMTSKPRGFALFINNVYFEKRKDPIRKGANLDKRHLDSLLQQLGYIVQVKTNVKSSDLERIIDLFKKEFDTHDVDSCLVFVSSHGFSYEIEMVDGKLVNLWTKIVAEFSKDACPKLQGKPKLFFFNSCQSFGNTLTGKPMQFDSSDILVCFSCLPGFLSQRSTSAGSFYIYVLTKVFMEHAQNKTVIQMHNMIQKSMRYPEPEIKGKLKQQLPYCIPILFEKFYFYPEK